MRRLALVALAITLAACDSGREADTLGTFSAEVTGESIERSMEGRAAFQVGTGMPTTGGDEDWIILTMAEGSFVPRTVTIVDPGRLLTRPGRYAMDPAEPEGLALLYLDFSQEDGFYGAASGEVEVTRSEDGRISGTFEATLADDLFDPQATVGAVSGTFDAEKIATPVPIPVLPSEALPAGR